jgi:arylsulfatase A-like enzyme
MNLLPRLSCGGWLTAGFLALGAGGTAGTNAAERPNVLFILVDDLGYGDLSCTGNAEVRTGNLDRLAREGIRFTQFYANSPICSPSRVAFTTGQYPARYRIHSYLASRRRNRERGMRDFLDPRAPAVARTFQRAGYATAHFGKWHMGGGRDVGEAPLPQAYGFDESLVSFEGLGDRVLPPGALSQQSEELGRGRIDRAPKHRLTEIYVDRAIDFVERRARQGQQPFYAHLWLNDVHDAHVPSAGRLAEFERFSGNPHVQRFYAVLAEMDAQLGRLIEFIDGAGLAEETIILLTSDNGPTAWPSYYRQGHYPPGSTAGFRGRKWSLYEGGIRMPLIVRWPGRIPAGQVDDQTIFAAIDYFPTICRLADIEPPPAALDGEDLSAAFLGRATERQRPVFWEYGRDESYLKPWDSFDRSPNLAVRDGRWKLLMRHEGNRLELYDLSQRTDELENVAAQHPQLGRRLAEQLLGWRVSVTEEPSGALLDAAQPPKGPE